MTPFPQASTHCHAIMEKEDYSFCAHINTGAARAAFLHWICAPNSRNALSGAAPRWSPKTAVLETAKGGSCLSAAHISVPLAHSLSSAFFSCPIAFPVLFIPGRLHGSDRESAQN